MESRSPEYPRVLRHEKVGDRWIMDVQLGTTLKHVSGMESEEVPVVREFIWGECPRDVVTGEAIVTEDAYVGLQACEAWEVLAVEMQWPSVKAALELGREARDGLR